MPDTRIVSGVIAIAVAMACCVALLALAGPGKSVARAHAAASYASTNLPHTVDALAGTMKSADARTLKDMSSAYKTAAALHPDDANTYLALATVELARGHSVAAQQALTRWQQLASGR